MYLIRKLCDLLLFVQIELSLVHTIRNNRFSQLASGQMMQNHALLSGVCHRSVIEIGKFFRKLCFLRQPAEHLKDLRIHRSCRVIKGKAFCHRRSTGLNALCALLPGHNLFQDNRLYLLQVAKGLKRIQILPIQCTSHTISFDSGTAPSCGSHYSAHRTTGYLHYA